MIFEFQKKLFLTFINFNCQKKTAKFKTYSIFFAGDKPCNNTAPANNNATASANTPTNAINPPLNAAVKKNDKPTPPLPDKPVECTICSRKFKNIPALNGHMRLHGGYYKKDADGRRLVGMANTSPLKTMMNR